MTSNPNKIISLQELINAQVDAKVLELIMNEAPLVEVETRLGRKCYSISTIQAIIDQYKLQADVEIANLTDAINVALAAGAGAAGWTDSLVRTWSGRTQGSKNTDSIHVLDFKTGKTDQEAIQDAVNYCLINKKDLNWDGANLTSTSNIANFWKVRHVGGGFLNKPNSIVLAIEPVVTGVTTLYISPNGNNENDGLTPDNPRLGLTTSIGNFYINPQFTKSGQIKFKLLAGTFSIDLFRETESIKLPQTNRPIFIEGTYSGTYPEFTHDSIVRGAGIDTGYGITTTMCSGRTVKIHGIRWEDMYSAIQLWEGVDIETKYNYFKSISIPEFYQGTANINSQYNIYDDVNVSHYAQYSSRATINNNTFRNIRKGPYITRNSSAHVDYNDFDGCDIAIRADLYGRVSSEGNKFRNTKIALGMQANGIIANNPSNDFGVIGVDTLRAVCIDGVGQELRWNGYTGARDHIDDVWAISQSMGKDATTLVIGNSLNNSTVLKSIPKGIFQTHFNKIKCVIYGTGALSSSGTVQINLIIAGTTYSVSLINQATSAFEIVFELFCGSSGLENTHGVSFKNANMYLSKTVYHADKVLKDHDILSTIDLKGGGDISVSCTLTGGSNCTVRRVELTVR